MFQREDLVLYGSHGICKIVDLEIKKIDRKQIEFYVLEPIDQSNACYYIPTQNQTAVAKLRPIITYQELETLLHSQHTYTYEWISDENQRKQLYRELITSGDRKELVRMVHALHRHKQEQELFGRKIHLCDENFLRDAKKLLDAEFSLVLGIPENDVGGYIQNAIAGK